MSFKGFRFEQGLVSASGLVSCVESAGCKLDIFERPAAGTLGFDAFDLVLDERSTLSCFLKVISIKGPEAERNTTDMGNRKKTGREKKRERKSGNAWVRRRE
jgi:hypothetical protein